MLRRAAWLLLLLAGFAAPCLAAQGSTQTDQMRLLAQSYAITNWDAYKAANDISGWVADNSVPVCLWTGVTCNPEGRIESLALQCPNCAVKAQGTVAPNTSEILTMKTLNLQQQQLSGPLPPEFGSPTTFQNLFALILQQNQLTGTIPKEWNVAGAFPRMSLLAMHYNNFTGDLPEPELWPQLGVLRLQHNQLSGTLPGSWAASLPNLQILSIHQNQLRGPMPFEWYKPGTFQKLEEMYIQSNQLTGEMPANKDVTMSFPRIRIMDMSFNKFTGGLPPGWGMKNTVPNMELMYVRGMGLNGTLPPDWGSDGGLQKLRQLWIDGNNLSGTIPAAWNQLTSLEYLYVKPGNPKLCGPLPAGMPFKLCDATGNSECNVTAALDGPDCPPWVPPDDGVASSTNVGAIVGGVVGGVAGGVVLAILGVAAARWNRRRKQRMSPFIAEANGTVKPAKDDLSNYNTVLEALEGGADPDLDAEHRSWLGRQIDRCFTCGSTVRLTSDPNESAGAAGGSPLPPLPSSGGSGAAPAAPLAGQAVAKALSSAEAGAAGGFLYTNDSTLLSQEMSATSQLVQQQQNTRLSNNSTAGERSSGAEEARDQFAVDGLASLSDWEIRPEEIEYMKRPDGSDWELGTGGFGKVFKALRNGAQPVAVKVLMSGPETRYMAMNEFRREVAILKACRDPNIVAFLGACMHDDCAMLVTEYCEGGNLARNIVAGKVSWYRRGRRIALDIAKGLVFLHSRRIVHLDLKSPNILLSRDGTAKIADVGLAKIIAQEYSAVTGAVGTLAWSSPEMLLGARCTERSDIYSYGVVLWEIATGQTPIRGQLRDVKVPEECPDELRKLMLDCLEQNPRRRPTAVQIIERLRKIPVSPREHAPALPQGSTPTRHATDPGAPRAVTGAVQPRVPRAAGANAAKTAPARGPTLPPVPDGEGISPFAMAAAAADAAPAADMPRLASSADGLAGKPSGTVLGSQEGSSLGPSTSNALLAPAGSLPTPFKAVQQQPQQERQPHSELATQLPSSEGSSDLVSSRDAGSVGVSRAGSGTVVSPSRKGSLPVRAASRQPSLPPGGLPPGMPRPPPSPFAGSLASLSPGQQPSSPQNGTKETPR